MVNFNNGCGLRYLLSKNDQCLKRCAESKYGAIGERPRTKYQEFVPSKQVVKSFDAIRNHKVVYIQNVSPAILSFVLQFAESYGCVQVYWYATTLKLLIKFLFYESKINFIEAAQKKYKNTDITVESAISHKISDTSPYTVSKKILRISTYKSKRNFKQVLQNDEFTCRKYKIKKVYQEKSNEKIFNVLFASFHSMLQFKNDFEGFSRTFGHIEIDFPKERVNKKVLHKHNSKECC